LGQYGVFTSGALKLSASTVRRWLRKWNLKLRAVTTSAQTLPTNWEELRDDAVQRLALLVEMYDIPPELVINSDQMAQYLVPSANKLRTYARRWVVLLERGYWQVVLLYCFSRDVGKWCCCTASAGILASGTNSAQVCGAMDSVKTR
jgi:hypothetical protein